MVKAIENKYIKNCKILSYRQDYLHVIPKDAICAEIGVMGGDFSNVLLKEIEPKELHLIDTFNSYDYFRDRFTSEEHYDYVNNRFREEIAISLHKGFSHEVLEKFKDNYFDFIYVDADHSYEAVKKDLEMSHKKLKNNGYIACNDYKDQTGYGVIQAVNEFCKKYNYNITHFALNDYMYSDVLLRQNV